MDRITTTKRNPCRLVAPLYRPGVNFSGTVAAAPNIGKLRCCAAHLWWSDTMVVGQRPEDADGEAAMKRGKLPQRENEVRRKSIVISANSFWNIENFRTGLINALVAGGHRVIVVAPGGDPGWASARGAEVASITIDRSGLNPLRDIKLFFNYVRI